MGVPSDHPPLSSAPRPRPPRRGQGWRGAAADAWGSLNCRAILPGVQKAMIEPCPLRCAGGEATKNKKCYNTETCTPFIIVLQQPWQRKFIEELAGKKQLDIVCMDATRSTVATAATAACRAARTPLQPSSRPQGSNNNSCTGCCPEYWGPATATACSASTAAAVS